LSQAGFRAGLAAEVTVPAMSSRAVVVTHFQVAEHDAERFLVEARDALEALARRPGYVRGHVGRGFDDPTAWLLVTEWDGVGSYRRALSDYDVKVRASPLLGQARDEPSGFEVLLAADAGGAITINRSDRAPDADSTGPGRTVPAADERETR
jgi:hypothetical protein